MKHRFLTLAAWACLALLFTGCYTGGDGSLKTGVPFSKDKIVSRYERPYDQVKAATLTVLRRLGTVTGDDLVKKLITAKVDTHTVWVTLDDAEPKIVRVVVQARSKGGAADVDLASEIDKQIYGELITR